MNRSRSPYGMGWSVAGLQSLHLNPDLPGVVMLAEGDKTRVFDRRTNIKSAPIFQYGTPLGLPDRLMESGAALGDPLIGDFDSDGIPDVALRLGGSVLVMKGRGDATFEFLYEQAVSIWGITQLIGDDLNGDGRMDLVCVSRRDRCE